MAISLFWCSASPITPITAADHIGFSGLDDGQWQTLMQMLNERKQPATNERLSGKFFFESWIIDTGASNHMTGSYEFLQDVCDMSPVYIKLPDGRYTISTKQGKVSLGSALILRDVFFNHNSSPFSTHHPNPIFQSLPGPRKRLQFPNPA